MMSWTWRLDTRPGQTLTPDLVVPEFPSQSDAESWLGETWRELAEAGAVSVSLLEDDRVVYGPMSLESE